MSRRKEPNQLYPELMSFSGLNPFHAHVSSPRGAMFTGNMGQYLAVKGATKRFINTGMEREFAKGTFSLRFDCDAEIIKVIHRFPGTQGIDSIKFNPLSIIIYEDVHTKEVKMLEMPNFHSTHQHFGFEYKYKDIRNSLHRGMHVRQGTIVGDSPLVDDDGDHMFGLEANVAFMSDPAVTEDGIKVSRSFLEKCTPTTYETRVIMFGAHDYPINLYGNDKVYKPFPDIGEKIHTHGLLFALREYDEVLGVVNMTPGALCEADYIYDHKVYAEPEAVVVDIKVECNTNLSIPPTPMGMEEQLYKYYDADTRFYKEILDIYYDLRFNRERSGMELKLDPIFHGLIVEALNRIGPDYHPKFKPTWREKLDNTKVSSTYRGMNIPHWRVEITYRSQSIPNIGFKATDTHGGKGVICSVAEDEDMPVDDNGVRADIIMDDLSTTRRLNPARFYEQYLNAASRDVVKRIKERIGFDPVNRPKSYVMQFFNNLSRDAIMEEFEYVMGYYRIVSPRMFEIMANDYGPDDIRHHLMSICTKGIYLYFPPNNPVSRPEMIEAIEANYPPFITPVTFTNLDGRKVRTVQPILIGSMYYLILEKTAEDWSAVSSAKRNHYGTTARLTNFDKHSAPGRQQPTKTIGEAEDRLLAAVVDGENVANVMDASNNPQAHKYQQRTILMADRPTDIECALDRNEIPKGGHRPLSFVNHMFQCSGKEFCRD